MSGCDPIPAEEPVCRPEVLQLAVEHAPDGVLVRSKGVALVGGGIALRGAKLPFIRQAELHVGSGLGFPFFLAGASGAPIQGAAGGFSTSILETLVGTAHGLEHQASDAYALICAEIAFNVHVQLSDPLRTA